MVLDIADCCDYNFNIILHFSLILLSHRIIAKNFVLLFIYLAVFSGVRPLIPIRICKEYNSMEIRHIKNLMIYLQSAVFMNAAGNMHIAALFPKAILTAFHPENGSRI